MKHAFEITNSAQRAFIKIVGEINFWKNSSKDFTQEIDRLIAQGVTELDMYSNSPGGSMFEANEIANQVQRFQGKKRIYLGAIAASASSYLMTYFDEIIASENTQIMMHDPIQKPQIEHLEDFDSAKALYTNLRNIALERYKNKMGISLEEASEMMRNTTWLSAQQALKKKLIDSIRTDNSQLPENLLEGHNGRNAADDLVNENQSNQPTQPSGNAADNNQPVEIMNLEPILNQLNLSSESSEDKVVETIKNLKQTAEKAVLELGKQRGMNPETLKKVCQNDLENTLELVLETKGEKPADNSMNQVVTTLENALKKGSEKGEKTLNDYTPQELEDMAENKPEQYQQLINKAYPMI